MKKLILFCVILFTGLTAIAEERGEFSFRPYRCRFFPSNDIAKAIAHYDNWYETKKPYMERWSKFEEKAIARIERECYSAVEIYGQGDPESCLNYSEEQMYCKRKWQGYYEW